MLPHEFKERTGIDITRECYYTLIDGEYNDSHLDKNIWCRNWLEKGGPAEVYNWQIRHDIEEISKRDEKINELNRQKKYLEERLNIVSKEEAKWRKKYFELQTKNISK